MIGIIDYGVGNIFSVKRSLSHIGEEGMIVSSPCELKKQVKLILPGVGAFRDAMESLEKSGMKKVLLDMIRDGIPILGICLGMQILFESSSEHGLYKGLGVLEGRITDMGSSIKDKSYKIPQMGWNSLKFPKDKEKSELFKYVQEGEYVYFVHSYSAVDCDSLVTATTEYGFQVTAAVGKDNVYGTQFHPEKSGETGLSILKAFCEI